MTVSRVLIMGCGVLRAIVFQHVCALMLRCHQHVLVRVPPVRMGYIPCRSSL